MHDEIGNRERAGRLRAVLPPEWQDLRLYDWQRGFGDPAVLDFVGQGK
jgi:hypothetical protein